MKTMLQFMKVLNDELDIMTRMRNESMFVKKTPESRLAAQKNQSSDTFLTQFKTLLFDNPALQK
jgi:hypothetical protein